MNGSPLSIRQSESLELRHVATMSVFTPTSHHYEARFEQSAETALDNETLLPKAEGHPEGERESSMCPRFLV